MKKPYELPPHPTPPLACNVVVANSPACNFNQKVSPVCGKLCWFFNICLLQNISWVLFILIQIPQLVKWSCKIKISFWVSLKTRCGKMWFFFSGYWDKSGSDVLNFQIICWLKKKEHNFPCLPHSPGQHVDMWTWSQLSCATCTRPGTPGIWNGKQMERDWTSWTIYSWSYEGEKYNSGLAEMNQWPS